jgi:hypothetical protein
MTAVRDYYLLDGAMMGGLEPYLAPSEPVPAWIYPLADRDDPCAMLGPILCPRETAETAQPQLVRALCDAVPAGLHWSAIYTALSAEELAGHLRQFTRIWTEDRQVYFLRFSDCRVLDVLTKVLTPAQWNALTGPMTQWRMHIRDRSCVDLPMAADGVEASPAPWVFSDAQIDACIEAQEPDILLNQLGYTLDSMAGKVNIYWAHAKECVEKWKASGSDDRQLLFEIAKNEIFSALPAQKITE